MNISIFDEMNYKKILCSYSWSTDEKVVSNINYTFVRQGFIFGTCHKKMIFVYIVNRK